MKKLKHVIVALFVILLSAQSYGLDFKAVSETIKSNDIDAFTRLVSAKGAVTEKNKTGETILVWISGMASPEYLKVLVSKGADINALMADADINMKGYNPLMVAAWGGNLEGLKYFESLGLSPLVGTASNGTTPMEIACREGRLEVVKYLFPKLTNKSIAPNAEVSYLGWSIMYESYNYTKPVSKFLIEQGVDINADKEGGFTASHYLARGNSPEIFKLLLSQNYNWEKKTQWGSTPIFEAVRSSVNVTRELLKKKVNLNLVDGYDKSTVLQTAVKAGNAITVQMLLDAGMKSSVINPANGLSAIDYAKKNDRAWLVPILEGKKRVEAPKWTLDDEISTGIIFRYEYKGNLDLKSIGGTDKKLSSYWGTNTVLLNIWASWCPPCVQEMPSLQAFYDKNKSKGFVVLAQSVDENQEDASQFMKDYQLTFPLFTADFAYTNDSFKSPYPSYGIPTSYIFDKNGISVASIEGSRDWSKPEYQRFLDAVMSIPKWY